MTTEPVVEAATGGIERPLLDRPVGELMTTPPVFADPEQTVRTIAQAMASEGVGSLILIRPDGPSAIVTERDLVQAVADGIDPDTTWAVEVASDGLVSVSPEDSVAEAVEEMVNLGIRHLPVKVGGTVIGLVSAGDLLVAIASERS